ncbi:MAG: Rieske (2Fe-2S) protein [Terriglobia bacterium]
MVSASESGARWVCVARTGDVSPGQVQRVESEGWVLALVNHEGKFYAFHAVCPHRGGPLDQGELWPGTLECPWHRHRYDLATGANVYPRSVYPEDMPQLEEKVGAARVFPVEVRGDRVFVGLPAAGRG